MIELIIAALIASCLWWAGIIARHLIWKQMMEARLDRMMAELEEMVGRKKEELNG